VVAGAAVAAGAAAGGAALTTGDDTGAAAAGGGVGITGMGGAVLVTTGAAARALASALTAPELVLPAPALGAAGGTREKVLVTTGMRWTDARCNWPVRRIRRTVPAWRTVRPAVLVLAEAGTVFADDAAFADDGTARSFGTATAGNRATGTDKVGTDTATAGGSIAARTDAARMLP
jgi:hypothetical protein